MRTSGRQRVYYFFYAAALISLLMFLLRHCPSLISKRYELLVVVELECSSERKTSSLAAKRQELDAERSSAAELTVETLAGDWRRKRASIIDLFTI
eukprot:IDg19897t1